LISSDRLDAATHDTIYTYDVVGNRATKTVGSTQTTYQYDALDRLTSETTGGSQTAYDYDGNGNLSQKTTVLVSLWRNRGESANLSK